MKEEFQNMVGSEEGLIEQAGLAGRLATSEEIAGPIVFLNSEMATFVSGMDLCVDAADTSLKILKKKKNLEDVSATNPIILKLAKMMVNKSGGKKKMIDEGNKK